jgi:FkbM family methyltransferase
MKPEDFNAELSQSMKQMMADGIWPDSVFWPLAKYNAMIEIGKKNRINISFTSEWKQTRLLSKFIRNYASIKLLARIYNFRRIFKRYHKIDGLKFYIKTNKKTYAQMNDIVRNYQCLTEYEPATTNLVKKEVKPGDVCIDIGASIGYFTLQMARAGGRVIAIEPTDFQQDYLRKNIRANGFKNVTQLAVGAWDKDEVIRMPRNAPKEVQTELLCRSVDSILEELGVDKVDFIKIDTDGAEPWVLKGLIKTIERSPNLKVVIEYYPKYVKDAGGDIKDVDEILKKYFTSEVIDGDYGGDYYNLFCTRK